MNLAFFAATPFQVFNCMNIFKTIHKNDNADLFLLTFAVDMSSIKEGLEREKIFRNVYVLDKINCLPGKRGVIKDFLFTNSENKRMLTADAYDVMYTTFIGDRNNLYYNLLLNNNPRIKLVFYDEGIGIYTQGFYKSSEMMQKFYKLLGMKYVNIYYDEVLVYAPESVMTGMSVPIKKIPCVSKNDGEFKRAINTVFRYSKLMGQEYKQHRLIYFDQDFARYLQPEEARRRFRFSHLDFLDKISSSLGKKDILIKKHPIRRDDMYEKSGFSVAARLDLPWEIIQLNGEFQDKILVGINSTALLTSKLIYNEEPRVIVLGKLIAKEGLSEYVWNEKIENLFLSVQNMYHDKGKFVVPNSYDEFIKCICG